MDVENIYYKRELHIQATDLMIFTHYSSIFFFFQLKLFSSL